MKVISVLRGKPEPTPAKSGMTGHFKKPVTGALRIERLGLSGDTICDTKHHGGVDQAVYIFGDLDRIWWAERLDRDVPAGFFGENLLLSDLTSATLCLGDVLAIGDVRLQITAPRIPCATYAAHIGTKHALKDFFAAGRPGAYARVLSEGMIEAGMTVDHIPFDGPRITVVENMQAYQDKFRDHDFLRRALEAPAHHKLHEIARAAFE
jgi:MOSC domain-containing protein YiiM